MSIQFIINGNEEFKDYTLITGFHGMGTTGFIAVNYLINQLAATRIGIILSDFLPPFITTREGQISLPFELFQKDRNLMLIPHFQPYRHEQRIFTEKLVEWTVESKFRQAVLIGGLDARLRKDNSDKIRVVATTVYLEKYQEDLPLLEEGLFVTGPLALLLAFYEIKQFPAIALLPYAESSRADPLAAAIAIEKVNEIAGLKVDTKKLIQDAESIEHNLQELVTQTKEQDFEGKEQGTKRLYI